MILLLVGSVSEVRFKQTSHLPVDYPRESIPPAERRERGRERGDGEIDRFIKKSADINFDLVSRCART